MIAIVVVGGIYLFSEKKQAKQISYGTFHGYFTSQESILYPLIFDDIRISNDPKLPMISFGPKNFEGFEIFMNVTKETRKESNDFKSMLAERNVQKSEGLKTTRNGYVGEVFSYDLKAHPEPDIKACNFGYLYFIPLADSDHDLVLEINARQSGWGSDGNYSNCKIFDDQNYARLKTIMDNVIDNIQPAF
ncbi:MAG: hypothetical protein AAB863_01325 [Patescibacteria group bacterium]